MLVGKRTRSGIKAVDVKSFVQVYYRELYSRECVAAMARFLTDDYVEHQYTAGFTKAGLRAYVEKRLAENRDHRMIIHHAIQEGDFVFLFVEEKLANGIDVARAELFRTANGRIAEHWGAHVIDEKNRKNDNGTFDGSRVNRDVDHGRKHAARFEELDVRGFDGQELEAFFESRTPDYKQHSPKGGDGRDGLVNILKKMKETGTKMIMLPKRTIVEGDFIVSHRFYDTSPPHPLVNRINTFDVFRLNADGKAVEHWDVMEDVPSADMLDKLF
jgi:predicted SnoaL-like aldol condensation-catalyzing enzyme